MSIKKELEELREVLNDAAFLALERIDEAIEKLEEKERAEEDGDGS